MYVVEFLLVGILYFLLTTTTQSVLGFQASAAPIWPPSGLGLAAVILLGARMWPAIALAVFAAGLGATTEDPGLTGSILVPAGIAAGYAIAAVVGGHLTAAWFGGTKMIFGRPLGVLEFGLIASFGAAISAAIGVGIQAIVGYVDWSSLVETGLSWWLADAAGVLILTPAIVLWAESGRESFNLRTAVETGILCLLTGAAGAMAFGPLNGQGVAGGARVLLAALPPLWAALRYTPRMTASTVVVLACFAVWGIQAGARSVGAETPGSMLLILFAVGVALPSLALSTDIRLRRGLEAALRQRERHLRVMFAEAAAGIAQMDQAGAFQLTNRRFEEIVQRSAAELLQLGIADIVHPDDRAALVDQMEHASREGEAFTLESRCVLPDGSWVWLKSNISPMSCQDGRMGLLAVVEDASSRHRALENLQRIYGELLGTLSDRTAAFEEAKEALETEAARRTRAELALKHDIFQRRKAEEARRESEGRFRLFIDGVTDYALCMLDRDGNITSWNTGAQRIHQYAAAEITGKHFSQFYSEEDQKRGEPTRALQIAAYEGKHVVEGWRMRRDGSAFWASVVIEAIRDENGSLIGFAEITRDITERREAEAALQRAKEQLAQSQKMEALGQLTGSIAHDFNNLLMIVSGHAQLLRKRLSDAKQLQSVDALQAAASRGESLTRQLLAFSRRQALSPVVVDLRERIDAVYDMLVGSLRGNIGLIRDIPADLWPVEVDIAELELALVNIAVNARDAMPGGGTITVSARNVTLTPDEKVEGLEGDFIALALSDTGVGIAPDILPRIFEPFFTTKGLGKGTGLGLAQVYGFAQQSGGRVSATSVAGGGTTITIYLPRSHSALSKLRTEADLHSIAPAQGMVLVVEDSPEVAEVTCSLVEQLGYRTTRVENAAQALSRLQQDDTIDLVFSDIVMPGAMNGIALAQVIAKRHPDVPIVLTSGYSDMVQAAESRFVVLRKPFQLPAVEKAFREALQKPAPGEGAAVLPFGRPNEVAR